MDWTASAMSIITFFMVLVLIWQVWELRRATSTQAFCSLIDRLQDEEVRKAREIVLEQEREGNSIDLTGRVQVGSDEKVCHTYDVAGIMVNSGMVPKRLLTENWGHSIKRCWQYVNPLVSKYRKERSAPKIWDDFESLAKDIPDPE